MHIFNFNTAIEMARRRLLAIIRRRRSVNVFCRLKNKFRRKSVLLRYIRATSTNHRIYYIEIHAELLHFALFVGVLYNIFIYHLASLPPLLALFFRLYVYLFLFFRCLCKLYWHGWRYYCFSLIVAHATRPRPYESSSLSS